MKRTALGITGIKWLRATHLIVSVVWLGGALSMNLLRFAWTPSGDGDLYAVDHAIMVIDHSVVVPAAFASLFTGLLESWLTTWGFIKYRWVTMKWIATIAVMVYAPLFQAQWLRELESISGAQGLAALQNPVYLQDRLLYSLSGIALITTLGILTIVSVLKPWMRKRGRVNESVSQ